MADYIPSATLLSGPIRYGVSFGNESHSLAHTGAVADTAEDAADWARHFLGRPLSELLAATDPDGVIVSQLDDDALPAALVLYATIEPGECTETGEWIQTLDAVAHLSHDQPDDLL